MIKGTPQEKRNNAWHTKHTKKKAEHKLYRLSKVSKSEVALKKAEVKFKKWTAPKQSFLKRLFNFKTANA